MKRPEFCVPIPKAPVQEKAPKKRINPRSKKRQRDAVRRLEVRALVEHRDGWVCQGPPRGLPGECQTIGPRQDLELHETTPRGRDSKAWLDPDKCVLLCPRHHDAVTSASGEALRLARLAGLDVKAEPLPSPTYQRRSKA